MRPFIDHWYKMHRKYGLWFYVILIVLTFFACCGFSLVLLDDVE